MEQGKINGKPLLAAAILGLVSVVLICIYLLNAINIEVRLQERLAWLEEAVADPSEFEEFKEFLIDESFRHNRLIMVITLVSISLVIAALVFNLIAWKKKNKRMAIIAIPLYFLTLNFISAALCIIGILWNSDDELDAQKRKSPLFVASGILGLLGLISLVAFLFSPMLQVGDDGLAVSLFSFLLDHPSLSFITALITGVLGSLILAITISFAGKLRNNAGKVLLAGILYLFSLSIPSAVLCFIGYKKLKKAALEG
jgi:uncharacterized membrane protein